MIIGCGAGRQSGNLLLSWTSWSVIDNVHRISQLLSVPFPMASDLIMSKPTVSLVIIDTSTYRLASQAVQHSVQNFPFDEILIFSDVTSEWEGRDVHIIPRIQNLTAYSEFVIFKLPSFIKTDFFLIIQWDGFVIRGDEFSPHFYHYDYIGALWPWYTEFRVGNGGFSWRSKKLADAVLTLSIEQRAQIMRDQPNEDVWICRTNRVHLEDRYNIYFAGPDIAAHFSLEYGTSRHPTFGFHGIFQMPYLYADNLDWFIENLPIRVLESEQGFSQIGDGLKRISPPHYDVWAHKREALLKKPQ